MVIKKKLGLDETLALIKAGSSPAEISRKFKLSKQTIDYKIQKLKKMGCIEKLGYGVWEFRKEVQKVPKGSKAGQNQKQIRGHAFIWKIEFTENYNWDRAVRSYQKKKLTFQKICNNKVYRLIYQNRKIWLTKKGIVIYEPLDFYGGSSFKVKGTAVFEMDRLIKDLLKELKLKFRPYRFTTSREHYGIVKNELARQYNDRKDKLAIRSEDGEVWMWIDDSKGLGELENNAPLINRGVQTWFNDHKKHNFKVTPSFLLGSLNQQNNTILKQGENLNTLIGNVNQNTKNLDYHAENMRSHVKAVKDLGSGVSKQNKLFERIAIVLEKLEGGVKK